MHRQCLILASWKIHSFFLILSLDHRRLDYDFIPGRYYEFTITATDNAPEGFKKSSSTTARVFMTNANDEAPVLEPENQIIRLKEGANAGEIVHMIQAYDPDGDDMTFAFESKYSEFLVHEYL